MKRYQLLIILLILALLVSCIHSIYRHNVNYLYDFEKDIYLFQNKVNYKYEDSIQVNIQVPLHEFLYVRKNSTSVFKTNIIVQYILINFSSKNILYQGLYDIVDSVHHNAFCAYNSKFTIPSQKEQKTILMCTLKDVNKSKEYRFLKILQPSNKFGEQHLTIIGNDRKLLFENIIKPEKINIAISKAFQKDKIFINYFEHFYDIARPPFNNELLAQIHWSPDSIYTVSINDNNTYSLSFDKAGIYFVTIEENSRDGVALFVFDSTYPDIANPNQMLQPLRYLTSYQVFANLEKQADVRKSVESFWLEIEKDADKARRKIKKFYTRVKYANIFFTSYKEGWRTDRGMVYIVYGKPGIVYKSAHEEIWTYGFDKQHNSVDFKFKYVENPFTDNDFQLIRISSYKNSWHKAVDVWLK